jgi:adenylate cyclase
VAALARYPGRIALAAEWLEPHDSQGAGGLVLVRPEALQAAVPATLPLGVTNLLQPRPGQPLRHPEAYRSLLASQGVDSPPSLALRLLQLAGRRSRQPDADRELHSYGPEGQLRRIPAWEVLDRQRWAHQPLRPAVRGALVLVGPVVSQGEAGHSSPFGALSGLEVLGTAVANSLEGDGLATWPAAPWQRALLAAGTVALAALLALSRPSLGWRLAVVSVALALQLLAVALALTLTSRWLQLLAPASGLVVLRRTFERYVAPSVVAEILADPAAAEGMLRGRVREVTVLFADLQGFTDLTRRRSAAGESELHVRQLNTYLGAMVEVISAHGGTVDKFIGDAVMAVFGSPVSRGVEQEAAAAVRCALAMRARLEQLNAIWREQGVEPLASGVGLASGVVLAGQIGSPQRLEFTVIGDTVNLASRLESLTRRLPSSVCIDAATARLLSGDSRFVLRSFGLHEIKGLEATEVFAVEPAAGLAAGACAAQPPS